MDERAFLRRLSSASSSELVQLIVEANPEERQVLKVYLGSELFDRLMVTCERAATRAVGPKMGNIVVLHGIMGGELTLFNTDGQFTIWVNPLRLLQGQFDRLSLDEDSGLSIRDVRASGIYMKFYAAQIASLSENWEVRPFFFDWRRDIRLAADELRNSADSWFGPTAPVHVVAHSMGGLVARCFIARHAERWKTMWDPDGGKRGGRLLMLGTPNHGSFAIPRLLFGNNDIVDVLSKINITHFGDREFLLQYIHTFTGVYQMMPVRSKLPGLDVLYLSGTYTRTAVRQFHLDRAEAFQREIAAVIDPARMIYVAGYNRATAAAIQDPSRLGTDAGYVFSRRGDGTVPHNLGLLDGVPNFYVDEEHSKLPQNQRVLNATTELLQMGRLQDETNLFFGLAADVRGDEIESQDELRQSEARRRSIKEAQAEQIRLSLIARDATANADAVTPEEQALIDLLLGHDPNPQSATPAPAPSDARGGPAPGPRATVLDPISLHVSVSHGDLRQARYPVAVGHYQDDTIVSAEAVLDRRLDGRLSRRFHLGLYPGADETVQYVEASGGHPPGALIIGLGEVGQLTTQKLTRGVTLALLEYAASHADRSRRNDGEVETLGLSTVLLGTYGGESLSIRDSIRAILQGVVAANRMLQAEGLWATLRFADIEIIELYEDQAIQAVYECLHLADIFRKDSAGQVAIGAEPEVQTREGGKFHRPANQYETGWWRRIKITQGSTNNLSFEILTDRARSELSILATQRQFVDKYIAETIRTARYDESLGATLFELLLPVHLKEQAKSGAPVVLILDSDAARYPWELLADRTPAGVQPLATSTGLLRQFTASSFRAAPRPATEFQALVVGDTQSGLPELKGAQDEAKKVAGILNENGYACQPLIKQDALALGKAFFAHNYRIMHLAAHGVYDSDYTKSGVVIGQDLFFTSAEFGQLRAVPELVFVNCCHLGRIDGKEMLQQGSPHRLAASVAQALMEIGVKAVVAAGWAVNDQAALKFAGVFYQQMLAGGAAFGDAVKEARKQTQQLYPNTNTWGAYQCYGNPGFRLNPNVGDGAWSPKRPYVARQEYIDQIRNVIASTRADLRESASLLDELDNLRKQIPAKWLDGEVLQLWAIAYGELKQFPVAIDLYRRALADPKGKAYLIAAQEFANLVIRYAATLSDDVGERAGLIEEARQWTDRLSQMIDTPQQLGYAGGFHRRLAILATGDQRQAEVRRARDAYRKAYQLELERTKELNPYFALNAVALASIVGDEDASVLADIARQCREIAVRRAQDERDFWSRVGIPDADFAICLIQHSVPESVEKLSNAYKEAFGGGLTARERASVCDHLQSVETMQPDTEAGRSIREAIAAIRQRIGCGG
jgi:CHAT domain-containing protein/pimeloyl-ACP methyl ester carboxylesterase